METERILFVNLKIVVRKEPVEDAFEHKEWMYRCMDAARGSKYWRFPEYCDNRMHLENSLF